MPNDPLDPLGPLAEGAAQLHEIFLSYLRAGFSEQQALYLIGKILTASSGGGQP